MALTDVYTGTNGTLTLADHDSAEGREAKAVTDAYELQTVGRVTDVRILVSTRLEEFHEIGRRQATSLHHGDVHISGTVGRAYVNGALLYLMLGRGAQGTQAPEPYAMPVFNLTVSLADPAFPGNSLTLELAGVKFTRWSFAMPEDDFVLEDAAFKALSVSVVDKEAPVGGGEPATKTPSFPA